MQRNVMRLGLPVLMLGVATSVAQAQITNNPVYVSPNMGTGLAINFDYGRGLNNNSGKLNAIGGRAVLGLGMITITAGASSVDLGAASEISFGGNVGVNVFDLPASPVSIGLYAGAGTINPGTAVTTLVGGASLGISPPMAGASVDLWAAPGIRHSRVSGASTTNFGVSGGVNLGLPMGIGAHVALDYTAISGGAPMLVGAGVHYKFSIPGLGMM